ncbi:MAG: O-antigen ligase family protein, partial [Paludibacteraceae bacterium]|nr:O-antigen ligase family protein [Paludibacteraceae bacterium]
IIIVYYVWLWINTLIHGYSLSNAVSSSLNSISLCIIMDYYLQKDTKRIIRSLARYLLLLVLINFVTILAYPDGMYSISSLATGVVTKNWFLGYKNPQVRIILPALTIQLISNYIKNKNIYTSSVIMLIIAFASSYLVDSGTAMFGVVIFYVAVLYFNAFKESKLLSIKNILIISLFISVAFVLFNAQDLLMKLWENPLGRNNTLTGRTYVWTRFLKILKENKFLGSGIVPANVVIGMTGYNHPHNYYLYVLFQGGIIGAIIIVYLIFSASKLTYQHFSSDSSHVLTCCIVTFFIMGITESLTECVMLYPLFVIASHIDKIEQIEKNRENKITFVSSVLPKFYRKQNF